MSENSPLLEAWHKYAKTALDQPTFALTDDMVSFMAGASSTVLLILREVEKGNGDVTELIAQMHQDVQDFADFVVEQRKRRKAAE